MAKISQRVAVSYWPTGVQLRPLLFSWYPASHRHT